MDFVSASAFQVPALPGGPGCAYQWCCYFQKTGRLYLAGWHHEFGHYPSHLCISFNMVYI